jgi:hypothetical protein
MNHQVVHKRYIFKLLITDLNSSYRLIIQYKLEEQLVDTPVLETVPQDVAQVVPMVDTQAGTLSVPLVGKLAEP